MDSDIISWIIIIHWIVTPRDPLGHYNCYIFITENYNHPCILSRDSCRSIFTHFICTVHEVNGFFVQIGRNIWVIVGVLSGRCACWDRKTWGDKKSWRAERDGWVHLQPAIVENNTISHQSSRNPLRYGWIHLLSAVVKNNSISHQSSRNALRYGWAHLLSIIVKITVSVVETHWNMDGSLTSCNSQ